MDTNLGRTVAACLFAAALAAGEPLHLEVQTGHSAEFGSVACSPDGRLIATSAFDQTVRLWDVASGLQVRTLVGHAYREVSGVGFSADGSRVYSISDGAMVHRVADGGIEAACSDPAYSLAALSGGARLVRLAMTADRIALGLHRDGRTVPLAELPRAGLDASGWIGRTDIYWTWSGAERRLRVLRATEDAPAFREAGPAIALPEGVSATTLAPSPDLRWLAMIATRDKARRLLVAALADGGVVLDVPLPPASRAYGEELQFVPGRQEVLHSRGYHSEPELAGESGVVGFTWPGGARRSFRGTSVGTESMSCTPDGRLLATADWDRTLRLWDLASGNLLREARPAARPSRLAVVAAPDGRRWALQDQRRPGTPWRILDLATGRISAEVPDAAGVPAFSADGAWFTPGSAATAARLDAAAPPAGAWVRPATWPAGTTLRGDPKAGTVTLSRDGRDLVLPVALPEGPAEAAAADRAQALKEPVTESGHADGRFATLSGWGSSGDWVGVIDLAAGRGWHRPSGHHLIENLLIDAPRGRLLYGAYDGFIGVRSLADGGELARFPAHAGAVAYASEVDGSNSGLIDPDTHAWGLQLIAGGSRLLSVGDDGTVRLWDAHDYRLIATLAASVDGDYILALADGRYLATPGGAALVAVVEDGHATSLDQRDLALNRPDEVLAALGHATPGTIALYRAAVERRWRQHGLVGAPAPGAAVSVELAADPPTSTDAATVELALRAAAAAGLDRLVITSNGVPVGGSAGIPVSGAAAERTVRVPLAPGLNRIQIAARDRLGGESLRAQRLVTRTGAAAGSTLHVVAIGVSDYADPEWRLAYAASDAQALAGRLQRSGGFAARRITTLLDREVTRERIAALRDQFAATAVQDTVVLFIAGHGLLDDAGAYWFATADTDFAAPSHRAVGFAELEGLLDGIPAQGKLLLMDTCHSGESDGSPPPLALPAGVTARGSGTRGLRRTGAASAVPLARLTRELFTDLRNGSGTVVIASAGGDEVAYEGDDWKGGVFTRSLLDGLDGAADDSADGRIELGELRRWLPRRVAEATGGGQRPMVRQDSALVAITLGGPGVDAPARPAWAVDAGADAHGHWAEFAVGGLRQRLRWCPSGAFFRGSLFGERGRQLEERQHHVQLTRGFWLAEAECSRSLWHAVMGGTAPGQDGELPVASVSHDEALGFCDRLAASVPRLRPRLPSEAEWEYACRAGTTGPAWWSETGDEALARHANGFDLARQEAFPKDPTVRIAARDGHVGPAPPGAFPPNPWGLRHMLGNVSEWTADRSGPYPTAPVVDPTGPADGDRRIVRGGSFHSPATDLRPARRWHDQPGLRASVLGFRIAAAP